MKKQEISIEYLKSQWRNIYNSAKSETAEKEKILKELNQNLEEQKLSINIQEINSKIVFVPLGRERFKERILYNFLLKIFGEKYTDEFWGMIGEAENTSCVSMDSFFCLAEKIKGSEEENADIPADTEGVKKLILLLYQNIRDREFSEALKGYRKLSEEKKELLDERLKKNLDYLLASTHSAMETDEYKIFAMSDEQDIFLDCLNKCKAFLKEENTENPEAENISKIAEKTAVSKAENRAIKKEKKEYEIFEESSVKANTAYTKKISEKKELKPKTIKVIMGETIRLFESHEFDSAVHNIKILAEADKIFPKNDLESKYLLEAVLLRTGRFFLRRKMEYKKYWGYFQGKYDMKIEFYQNIVKLRGYLGENSRSRDEEYEVWRRD